MERASIDELFIDVTAFCYKSCHGSEGKVDNGAAQNENDHGMTTDDNDVGTKVVNFQLERDAASGTGQLVVKETIVCHEASVDIDDTYSEIGTALRRGCDVALAARKAVFDILGFTLSAGISTNKLVAKLAASYGKPNGQVCKWQRCFPTIAFG